MWSADNSREAKGARNYAAAMKGLAALPGCARLQLYAAEALQQQNKFGEANRRFAEAMENRDNSIPPARLREGFRQWLNLYIQLEAAGDDAADLAVPAARVYESAAVAFPDEPDYDILISRLYLKAGDTGSAARCFSAAVSKINSCGAASRKEYQPLLEAYEAMKRCFPEGQNEADILPLIFGQMK
jgi:tetratricopeptide (TPR) repeat protein